MHINSKIYYCFSKINDELWILSNLHIFHTGIIICNLSSLRDVTAVEPKASWDDVWSGVLPEKPNAGVLNWVAVGAAQEPNELGVK